LLLSAGSRGPGETLGDAVDDRGQSCPVAGIGGGKGEHGSAVAQLAAVVHVTDRHGPRRPRYECRVISGRGARGIAVLRQCRGDLRLGELGRQPLQLCVVKIAQPVEVV